MSLFCSFSLSLAYSESFDSKKKTRARLQSFLSVRLESQIDDIKKQRIHLVAHSKQIFGNQTLSFVPYNLA